MTPLRKKYSWNLCGIYVGFCICFIRIALDSARFYGLLRFTRNDEVGAIPYKTLESRNDENRATLRNADSHNYAIFAVIARRSRSVRCVATHLYLQIHFTQIAIKP